VPKKATAWHGIRMVREANNDYVTPLTSAFPGPRLGPTGDVAKVYCATCHQGVNKPLGGMQMAQLYPGLKGVAAQPAAAAAEAGASAAVAAAAAKPGAVVKSK
jgi:photosynthetic reaction center cytochrome c subunit